VTEQRYYDALVAAKQNVVLQADNNGTLEDDGSMSVYASLQSKAYINVEAAAEGGSEGKSVLSQLNMLENLVPIIAPPVTDYQLGMIQNHNLLTAYLRLWVDWKLLGPLVGAVGLAFVFGIALLIQSIKLRNLKKLASKSSQLYERVDQ